MKKNKKIIKIFIVITLCFFMGIFGVKADFAAPSVSEYKVIVPNNKEINLYYNIDHGDSKNIIILTTVPSNTVLVVTGEYLDVSNVLYGTVKYNDKSGFIKLDEVNLMKEKFDYKELKKDEEYKAYLLISSSLYKGPSKAYGLVDNKKNVPANTIISSYYYDNSWIYIEYEDTKGWLNYSGGLGSPVIPYGKEVKLLIPNDTNIYDLNHNKSNIVIPKGTELKTNFSDDINNRYETSYLVEYKGVKGYVKQFDVYKYINDEAILMNKENDYVSIYDNPNGVEKNKVKGLEQVKVSMSSDKFISEEWRNESWYYVESSKIKGWVKSNDLLRKYEYPISPLKGNYEIYDSVYASRNKIKDITILEEELVDVDYSLYYKEENWYHLNNYKGVSGWLKNVNSPSYVNYPYSDIKLDLFEEDKFNSNKIRSNVESNLVKVINTKDYDEKDLKFKWYYVNVIDSNEHGWVLPLKVNSFNKTMNIYTEKDEKSRKIDFVSEKDKVVYIDREKEDNDNWYYIYNYNGISGWVNPNLKFVSEVEKERTKELDLIIYAIIVACVLVLTSIITIVIINKKRRTKLKEEIIKELQSSNNQLDINNNINKNE